jgi:hypothetical protein
VRVGCAKCRGVCQSKQLAGDRLAGFAGLTEMSEMGYTYVQTERLRVQSSVRWKLLDPVLIEARVETRFNTRVNIGLRVRTMAL